MSLSPDTRKLSGLKHFAAAVRYSASGARRAWQEAAFRQEVAGGLVLVALYRLLGTRLDICLAAAVLFLMLLAIEALNTAIEEIVDRVSPEISITGKNAKDLGSFAVLCALSANALLLGYAMIEYVLAILA
jgi:diacylglycerol kinase (ATP)